jgi:hypothetical protein
LARFQLRRAFAYNGGHNHLIAGSIITNDPSFAESGDYIWTGLTAQTMGAGFVPLDADGVAMKAASVFANEIVSATITGADSIGVQR